MPTSVNFDYVPDYSSQSEIKARVNVVRFGDGYVQRGASGINLFPEKWQLKFGNITTPTAQAIEDKLKEAAGGTILWKRPPAVPEDPYVKWMCLGWSRARIGFNNENLTCEFEQVFE